VSYLRFSEHEKPGRKTPIVDVFYTVDNSTYGRIEWYGPWRQYVFFPEPNTIWTVECAETIIEYIQTLQARRTSGAA
jgi:hypothetical protein